MPYKDDIQAKKSNRERQAKYRHEYRKLKASIRELKAMMKAESEASDEDFERVMNEILGSV